MKETGPLIPWNIEVNGEKISDEFQIAEMFNKFFVSKIETLKAGIDKDFVEDPLSKLREKMKDVNSELSTIVDISFNQ